MPFSGVRVDGASVGDGDTLLVLALGHGHRLELVDEPPGVVRALEGVDMSQPGELVHGNPAAPFLGEAVALVGAAHARERRT